LNSPSCVLSPILQRFAEAETQCSMVYHHFAAIDDVSHEHIKYIKPGGTLAIANIVSSAACAERLGNRNRNCDGAASPPPLMAGYEQIVAHMHRFSEEDIQALFVGARLKTGQCYDLACAA
jgi:hypothetical protein